ncbi:ATP-binding protein [Methylomonas sp. EFPC3]|uniref:ATP-binding protein n=1 Tax=Methylomonas sp. EFPC3 TaxID=3021710 RepID=UPI0024172626|nr:ATP-binding protein [Methylomonas sp. EFPC3]WFP49299.1 ATP-binding protein [Methylomonas sp. EFPC3]
MTNCYELKEIILIDSFWPGKTVLLKLDGHTNLSGTNGAGKTTFLRLMQLFWGERPSNIVGGSGSKKGFLDYYLPRASSYLVYEYQRLHGQICHVMVQSDGRGAKYKFIDAAYRQDYYIAESGFPRDALGIERLYRPTAEVSRFLAVDDYCSVIQCHQLSSGKKDLRTMQARFAMAATPINHIEKVIGSVIEKIGDFDVIKQMLIDISRGKLSQSFLQNEDEQLPFQLNKQHIAAWLADLNAAKEIEAKRADFDRLLQTIAELKQTLKFLSHLHFYARDKHKAAEHESEILASKLKQLSEQRDALQQNHKLQLEPKEDALIEAGARLKELSYQIEQLEAQKLAYEEQGAESFAVKAAKAEQYAKRQHDIQAELDALEHKTQEIHRFYEKQLTELQHRHETQTQLYQQKASDAKLQQSKNLIEAEAEFQQRKELLQQTKEQRLQPVNERRSQFKTDFQIKQNELKNPPIPAALAEQRQTNREALETASKASKQAYQAQSEAQSDYQGRLNHYQEIEQALKNKKADTKRAKERHADCQRRLRPEPASLQYFLEQEADGWQQTIGRVIAPDLLDRSDLAPQWTGQGGDFYGLSINLEALADRSYLTADKAKLEQEEAKLFGEVGKHGKECEELEAALQAANKLREQAKSAYDQARQGVQMAEKLEENLSKEAEALTDRIAAETAKAKHQLEQEIDRLSNDIKNCDQSLADIEIQHRQALKTLQDEHLERKGILESDLENLLETVNSQIQADDQQFEQEQSRIKQQLKSRLKNSGADEETILTLAAKLKEAEGLEKDARSFQRKAEEYAGWLRERWQQHPELCRQRGDCQSLRRQLEDDIDILKKDYQRQRAELNQQISAQEEEQKKNSSLSAQLEQCMEQLRQSPPVRAEDLPEYAAGTLPHLTQDSLKERKHKERDIQGGKQTLVQLFNRHLHSQLAEAWSQTLNAAAARSEFFLAEVLEIEQPLIHVLQMVNQVKHNTALQIDTHANDVNNFYLHLNNFERAIKHTGSELSKYVSEERYFAALGEITVNVRSKMSDLEYWQPLKKFGDHYCQYRDIAELSGTHEIPEDLVQAMGELTALLPAKGFEINHISLFDIEFSIFENGQLKHARNSRELKDVSSTGLSYLALITFFTGVTAMLRKQNRTVVCWPIDELGDLAPENIEAMMNLLAKQNIQILSATPTADRHVLGLFERRYLIDRQRLHEVELPESKLEQLLIAQTKQEDARV